MLHFLQKYMRLRIDLEHYGKRNSLLTIIFSHPDKCISIYSRVARDSQRKSRRRERTSTHLDHLVVFVRHDRPRILFSTPIFSLAYDTAYETRVKRTKQKKKSFHPVRVSTFVPSVYNQSRCVARLLSADSKQRQ